eukprot:CCRYP_014629-RC/>CCRYP_014629-RC protein AED:0.51 eAED:0.42 QI:0/-1/0/1/-1/1/1/0/212
MVLATHSDASYLSEPHTRSHAGGHFFLSSNADIPPNNGTILNIAHIIKHVMESATEAKLAACSSQLEKPSTYTSFSWNSVTSNLLHLSKPTMPWLKQSPMAKSSPNKPKPWTCASTGYAIMNAKNNFASTGALDTATTPITGPNITPPNITSTSIMNSSLRWLCPRCYAKTANTTNPLQPQHSLPLFSIYTFPFLSSRKGVMIPYYIIGLST